MCISNEAIGKPPLTAIQGVFSEGQKLPLPNEIFSQIIQKIYFHKDKFNFSLTCRQIHKIVLNEERYSHRSEIQLFIKAFRPYINQETLNYQIAMFRKFENNKNINISLVETAASDIKLAIIRSFCSYVLNGKIHINIINYINAIFYKLRFETKYYLAQFFFSMEQDLCKKKIIEVLSKINYYNSLKEIFNDSFDETYFNRIIFQTSSFPPYVRYFIVKPMIIILAADGSSESQKKIHELSNLFDNVPGGKLLILQKAVKELMTIGDRDSLKTAFLLIRNNNIRFEFRDFLWLKNVRKNLLRLGDKKSLELTVRIAYSFNCSIHKFRWFKPIIKAFVKLNDKENLEKIVLLLVK